MSGSSASTGSARGTTSACSVSSNGHEGSEEPFARGSRCGGVVLVWLAVIAAGILAMQWGAQRICAFCGMLRGRLGLAEVAGGALIGVATASPEISINTAAVLFGWPDLGLGAALGSNVPALPLVVIIAFLSTRLHRRQSVAEHRAGATDAEEAPRSVPHVKAEAGHVQVLPYLGIVLLLAALTLPPPWAGLQPIDGLVLLAAFLLYFTRATISRADNLDGARRLCRSDLVHVLVGLGAIAGGAVVAVLASRRVNDALGVSDLVGGLFITGLLCAVPESFAAWRLSRRGQATTAFSGTVADGITSITVALIPSALVGLPLSDAPLYIVNLGFVALCLAFYLVANHPRWGERFSLGKVLAFGGGYAAYLAAVLVVTGN
jgi:cation:H+ antiporter